MFCLALRGNRLEDLDLAETLRAGVESCENPNMFILLESEQTFLAGGRI